MFLFISGCGGNADAPAAETSAAGGTAEAQTVVPDGVTELILWAHWTGENRNAFLEIIALYNETEGRDNNLYVTVEHVEDENMEMMMRLMAARLADTMPDIVHVAQMSFVAMVQNGLFAVPPQSVQDYVRTNYFDANAGLTFMDGVYWGYPTEHQVMSLFWNRDHFEEEGLSGPPRTWDQLREYAYRLTRRSANGEMERAGFIFPFGFDEAIMTQHISMFWGAGLDLFPTETTTNLNSDVGRQLNSLFAGMAEDGSTNAGWLVWGDALNNGLGSMVMMDPWALNFYIRQQGIEGLSEAIHVAELPTPTGTPGPSMSRGFTFAVPVGSQYIDESWDFLKWLNEGPENRMMDFMVNRFEFLPSHRDFEFPSVWSPETSDTFSRILEISRPQPTVYDYEQVQRSIANMVVEIMLAGRDPIQAVADAEAEILRNWEMR